jgi:hypothetical protein
MPTFASDAERAQHHASGEEGDNFVHVEKMPDPTGFGGDSESEIDKLHLRALHFFPNLPVLIKFQSKK